MIGKGAAVLFTSLSLHELIYLIGGFVASFFMGLILGRLLFGGKTPTDLSPSVAKLKFPEIKPAPKVRRSIQRNEELEWRHEKLALTEQQVAEGHRRLGAWIEASGSPKLPREVIYPAARLFYLSESLREERNRLGSDLSRLAFIDKRVSKLGEDLLPGFGEGLIPPHLTAWRQKAKSCLEEVAEHRKTMAARQQTLPRIIATVSELEKTVLSADEVTAEFLESATSTLAQISDDLTKLPGERLHEATAQLDRKVLEMLENPPQEDVETPSQVPVSRFSGLLRILEVDSSAAGAHKGKAALLEAVEKIENAFSALSVPVNRSYEARDDSPLRPVVERVRKLEPIVHPTAIFVDQNGKESGALSLASENQDETRNEVEGKQEADSAGEKPADISEKAKSTDDFSMVIFCSNNPQWWNRDIYRGSRARARAMADIPGEVNWIGMRRLDTGEQVFCRITRDELLGNGEGSPVGFNGTNELFYDARHLGLFAESCSSEVETRFTYGGWGFGHRVNGFDIESEPGPPQASGWRGKEIPHDTVFEITVFAKLPDDVDESATIL